MNGATGWAITAGVITAWDILAEETMSSAFTRSVKHPRTRPAVVASWAILTAHLFGALPERYDPFKIFIKRVKVTRVTNA
jgi:hypothetical protein